MNIWLLILLMAAVTFGIRYCLYARADKVTLPPRLEQALKFSAPCVLTAIWVPAVLMPDGELALTPDNPYLVGALIAVLVALWKKSVLLTILCSMAGFFLWKWLYLGV